MSDDPEAKAVIPTPAKDPRGEYMQLLQIHNNNRIDYNTRKWETVKFFQSIILALLGGTVAAVITVVDKGLFCKSFPAASALALLIILLPAISALAAHLGRKNLWSESILLAEEEITTFKLAKFLDLNVKIKVKKERWLPNDIHLLMERWRRWDRGLTPRGPWNWIGHYWQRCLLHEDARDQFVGLVGFRAKNNKLYIHGRFLLGVKLFMSACFIFLVIFLLFLYHPAQIRFFIDNSDNLRDWLMSFDACR